MTTTTCSWPANGTTGGRLNADAFEYRPPSSMSKLHAIGSFPQFKMLSDDLMLSVLSFVADVPFETVDMSYRSTLTHVLPFVSKQFRALCASTDLWWRAALWRLLRREPYLWEEGLRGLIADLDAGGDDAASDTDAEEGNGGDESDGEGGDRGRRERRAGGPPAGACGSEDELIDAACATLRSSSSTAAPAALETLYAPTTNVGIHQRAFRYVASRHIRYSAPVFYMPGTVRLGREFGLHFFEPRYRLLISEVMAPYPVRFRQGEPIAVGRGGGGGGAALPRQFPRFIYANHAPLQPTTPACIAEVRQCLIHPNGTADVFLAPSAYVWLERVWERPDSGGLAEARAVRMGREASRSLEESVAAAQARRQVERWGAELDGDAPEFNAHGLLMHAPPGLHNLNAILQYIAARNLAMEEDDEDGDDSDQGGVNVD